MTISHTPFPNMYIGTPPPVILLFIYIVFYLFWELELVERLQHYSEPKTLSDTVLGPLHGFSENSPSRIGTTICEQKHLF